MKKRFRTVRRLPKNPIRDPKTLDDIMDEMAVKWALRAERLNNEMLIRK